MSLMSDRLDRPAAVPGTRRLVELVTDRSPAGVARRFAASAFLARVLNAGLGFITQIILARWMGDREYGIYAYVWVWLLVAGGIGSLGLPLAVLKFVPDYRSKGDLAGLRGFLRFVRGIALLPSIVGGLLAAALLMAVSKGEGLAYLPVALIALVILPLYILTDIQTGIARAYDYLDLGLLADYLVRPLLVLGAAGAIWLAGGGGTAVNIMAGTLVATAVTAVAQGIVLQLRLRKSISAAPPRSDLRRWADASWPLLGVAGFTLLLGSTDIIVLKLFVGPEDIALYFAATKIVAIASFVSYGVSNTSAHRFAEHVAKGDRAGMAALAAETVRWTFWPTLGVAALLALAAGPLLSLFGPQFAAGYPIVAILALGLVLGAAVGPADRALAMGDHGRLTAWIYGLSFLANLALAFLLIPALGLSGAALSTALAMGLRAALLFGAARSRLGISMFVFSGRDAASAVAERVEDHAELLSLEEAGHISEEWRAFADRALEPNLFFTPEMALAGMRHLSAEADPRLLVVRREGRLVGALPLVAARGRWLNPFAVRRSAAFYGTLSTPLLDPERPGDTVAAMVRALARDGQHGIVLPYLSCDGPAAGAFAEACARAGFVRVDLARHCRAMLRSPLPGAEYIRATLETRRRKEAERQRRRLADLGTLSFRVVSSEADTARDLDAFLELEAAGWKGRSGTALARAPGAASFIRAAAAGLTRRGAFRVATLALDGRAIASGLVGQAGRRAFYIKTTYDEAYARFSPGLLLTLDLTAHLLDDPGIEDADSIAVADHPMIDRIWIERLAVASVVVSTRPGGGGLFRAAVAAERIRETLVGLIKSFRGSWQTRGESTLR